MNLFFFVFLNILLKMARGNCNSPLFVLYFFKKEVFNIKRANKFLSFLFCIVILMTVFNTNAFAVSEFKKGKINSSSGSTTIYSLAGTTGHEANEADKNKSQALCVLENGTEIRILGEEFDGDGDMWYKILYGDSFENTGYAFNTRVSIVYDYAFDEDFETNLQNFPVSYHAALRSLHEKHPNWKFMAHNIGMSFDEAVESQYGVDDIKNTRKWVELSYGGDEWKDLRGYDEQTDSYITLETRWTYASRAGIEYFMDPRNSLDENKIFVFMLQAYNEEMYSLEDLRAVVKGTFLENGYDKSGDGTLDADAYLDDIITAAQQSGVSPYVLAATIIIEQGVNGTSDAISGNFKDYEGYYNFFNFSASGSTVEEITKSALSYAKTNDWSSRTAAIVGGAQKYADGYISVGQDTYYYKDFNVVNKIWWHQYAAALYDAWTSAAYLQKGFSSDADAALIFTIPIYSDMPSAPCGNPSEKPEIPEIANIYDINSDGRTDNRDFGMLMQYINGWNVAPDLTVADIYNDGKINNKDCVLLMRYINGWTI